jgi:hypothetical protein
VNVIVSYAIKSNIYDLDHGDCYGFVLKVMKTPGNWLLHDRSIKSGQRKKEHRLFPLDCLTASTPLHALPHPHQIVLIFCLSFHLQTLFLFSVCSTQDDVADGRLKPPQFVFILSLTKVYKSSYFFGSGAGFMYIESFPAALT